jgi:hypothetical protein
MANQSALTLVTPVIASRYDEINDVLMQIRVDLAAGTFKEFEKVETLHYARYVLLDDKLSNAKTNLVFSSDYDGEEEEHLALIAAKCGDLIDKLYCCCEDYPAPGERTPDNRVKYLKRWSNKQAAFYVGAPRRSLKQIKQECTLRDHIWELLHKGEWEGKTSKEVHSIVRKHVFDQPELAWAKEKITIPKVKWWNFVLVISIAILLLPLLVLVIPIWLIVLHFFYEKKDKPLGLTPSQLDKKHVSELGAYEDFHNQNQFTQIIAMKPGWFRRVTIQAILLYGKFRIHNEFVHGELMGIPTIHFARWVLLDNKKQVLFFSNFDGSWQQYLGDFIDKSGWGLTAIFSNTEKFPVSRYLFWGGAYDEEHFLAWSRQTQIPSQVWYCAYPHLSIKNVTTNSLIRSELIRDLSEEQAKIFLNRF